MSEKTEKTEKTLDPAPEAAEDKGKGRKKLYRPPTILIAAAVSAVTLFVIWLKVNGRPWTDAPEIGVGYAMHYAQVLPFALLATLGTVFCALSSIFSRPWCALTAGILFAVAACLMLSWSWLVAVQCVLCFVAYAVDIARDDVDMFN